MNIVLGRRSQIVYITKGLILHRSCVMTIYDQKGAATFVDGRLKGVLAGYAYPPFRRVSNRSSHQ
jgi:hypothetical protein